MKFVPETLRQEHQTVKCNMGGLFLYVGHLLSGLTLFSHALLGFLSRGHNKSN